jgi:hypothetical protein
LLAEKEEGIHRSINKRSPQKKGTRRKEPICFGVFPVSAVAALVFAACGELFAIRHTGLMNVRKE